jgi:hypothetical protein
MSRQLGRGHDWRSIGVQLAAYASWKARNFRWRTGLDDALAQGSTPESVAAEAIAKVLGGERAWDASRGPLLAHLKRVVDSLLFHLASSSDNRLQERLPDLRDDEQGVDRAEYAGGRHDVSGLMPGTLPDPENAVVERQESRAEARLAQLLLAVQHEPDLRAVLHAIVEHGDAKPAAIAARLGTQVTDVYNRLKRLRRIAVKSVAVAGAPMRRAV